MKENSARKPVFHSRRVEQQWLREQAIKLAKDGTPVSEVARISGVSIRAVYQWLAAYHSGGQQALHAKSGAGRPPKLDAEKMSTLAFLLRDNTPDQLRFKFGLWTLRLVGQLIEREFNWRPSKPTLSKLMHLLGFTPQRPVRRAWQQDDVLVERWRENDFPVLQKRAKERGATILFADEAGMRSDYHAGTTWSPRGRTPVVRATGRRFSIQMLSAISAEGELHFMLHEGRVNAQVFIRFLQQLMLERKRPVILVVDGHSIHKAKDVLAYVESTEGMLELAYLPPYSPQLNPDEQVWKNVKERVSKLLPESKIDLREKIKDALERLANAAHTVAGFFRHPDCRYAAGV
jgi:transposase